MKFSVNTQEFKDAIEKGSKALAQSKFLPIIQNVKVVIKDSKCHLIATNLEQYIQTEMYIQNEAEDGEFVFSDTKTLLKAIKFFTETIISFEVDESIVKISCGGKKAEQRLFDVSEFPETPYLNMNETKEYSCNVNKLKDRFNLIKYAASTEQSKPILQGIHFNGVDMVAIDGFRLALNKDDTMYIEEPFTVPQSALKLVEDVLEVDIKLIVNHKLISFTDGKTTVVSRLLDGEYVDYKKIIPTDASNMIVDIKVLDNSIKYLKTFNGKNARIAWNNDKLVLLNSTGRYESDIIIEGSFDYTIGFNADYMTDALKQFKSKSVNINMSGKLSPMKLSDEDDNNVALVLPIRISAEDEINRSEEVA